MIKISLTKNYRCQKKIVNLLNNIYNDKKYHQEPNAQTEYTQPKLIATNLSDANILEQYSDFMQLFIFNKSRFEKIGAKEIYEAVYSMKAYKFPSQYSPTDVLLDKTPDNPDKLFRILFSICDVVDLCKKRFFGQAIQLVKHKPQIFNTEFISINEHSDKIQFSKKVDNLLAYIQSSPVSLLETCNYLMDNDYCKKDLLSFLSNTTEYDAVFRSPFEQLILIYRYMDNQFVSTQHDVKGESHDKVCFIALRACKAVDIANVAPANAFENHKDYYIEEASKIVERFSNNLYFDFCEKETYNKFIDSPNSTNAKKCFKATSTKGALWAYKLFYVGCSRARKELVILVDATKVEPFKAQLAKKMTTIGFEIE